MAREKVRTRRYARAYFMQETLDREALERNRDRFKSVALVDCRYIGYAMNANFDGSVFIGCDFRAVDFSGSSFRNCTFEDCDLRGAVLEDCDFTSAACDSETRWPLGFDPSTVGVTVVDDENDGD